MIKRSFLFVLFVALFCSLSYAQAPQENISKYLALLKKDKEDTNKIDHIKWLVWFYRIVGKMDTAIKLGNEGMELAVKLNHQKSISSMNVVLGLVYWNEGNYTEALDRFFKALKIAEQTKSKKGIGVCCTDIGNIYSEEGDNKKSLEYYYKALAIDTAGHDTIGALILYANIGESYVVLNDTARAMRNILKSLQISKQVKDFAGIARDLNSIANIYAIRKEYNKALDYYLAGERLCDSTQDATTITTNLEGTGTMYLALKKYADAEKYLNRALDTANRMHLTKSVEGCNQSLSELYNATGQWQKAYKAFSAYSVAKDSLFNEDKNKQITSKTLNYEFEKKEAEIKADQDKKDTLVKAEKQRQSVITYAVSLVLILALILGGFMLRGYRQKQKANLVLQEKNRTILDSITYAKRLQDAILPPLNTITQHLPESFVLYKPKDIVAGDFYWMENVGDVILIAACDCTGHGVPGAMVSVVCSNALNRALKEFKIRDTGLLLDKVREIVIETFMKSGGEVKDGMDCSFCAINTKTNEIEWSGAYNPLWYIANGEMKEIMADKQPIGKSDNVKAFTTHKLSMKKGDMLYLFTDGYADQFGGPKGKKFKYRQLQQLIVESAKLKMEEQKKALESTLDSWKGNLEQVDDILVIGIRI